MLLKDFPSTYYKLAKKQNNIVILETLRYDKDNYKTFLFIKPIKILQIYELDEVPELFNNIEAYLDQNYYLAGYFNYELGYHFEKITELKKQNKPVAWFGVYEKPLIFNHITESFENPDMGIPGDASEENQKNTYRLSQPMLNINENEYSEKINFIKDYIKSGDTYQINFTDKYNFTFHGSSLSFYNDLKKKQRVSYASYIKSDNQHIICLSPELFLRIKDNEIFTRPMKGTAKRGKTLNEDAELSSWLAENTKNQSENLMIVDLIRNDLGRICENGTVKVHKLFSIEKYQTLFQMTSTVSGKIKNDVKYYNIFKSLFPSGSVTGAPKIRSMQIIHELEKETRGVYTGAIGYFSPNNEAVFNVPIRTISIEGSSAEMGVGSGIVIDSEPEDEYKECRLKADFLLSQTPDFELIESLLWDNVFPFLDKHIKRIQNSAEYFDYPCDIENLKKKLIEHSRLLIENKKYKIRIRLDCTGNIKIENKIIGDLEQTIALIAVSKICTDSRKKFLYHKTTNRNLYDRLFKTAQSKGFADIIFMNEKNEITEGAIHNIIIKRGAEFITPPIESGLLNGVFRQHLLETRLDIKEGLLYLKDLEEAEDIYICNAVRGLRKAKFYDTFLG
ncbi:MAG: aminodeoxychorismate synthase component I [Nitrospiraceae bacterium]|nr:aminodeoxychorismate synthase component I [Nitrospiraceae bacterium]